jgi:hypothetical protein
MHKRSSNSVPRRGKITDPAVEIDAKNYSAFVGELKRRITEARHRASLAVNRELILL